MEFAWAVSFSLRAIAMISSFTGSKVVLSYSITLIVLIKLVTDRGEKNRAVPEVGSTWLGPAR